MPLFNVTVREHTCTGSSYTDVVQAESWGEALQLAAERVTASRPLPDLSRSQRPAPCPSRTVTYRRGTLPDHRLPALDRHAAETINNPKPESREEPARARLLVRCRKPSTPQEESPRRLQRTRDGRPYRYISRAIDGHRRC